jgi:hypothetical protein
MVATQQVKEEINDMQALYETMVSYRKYPIY